MCLINGAEPTIRSAINKTEFFMNKANKVHKNFYDYSLVNFINSSTYVEVICPLHGNFFVNPNSHLNNNSKCIKCRNDNFKLLKKDFILKSNLKHNYYYDYSLINFIDYETTSKSTINSIKCPIHGLFNQKVNDHLNGSGCPSCAKYSRGWNLKSFINSCKKNNDIGIFYIIKCFNTYEEFYKLGITSRTIKKRYSGKKLPYNYEVIQCIEDISSNVFKFEKYLKTFIVKNSLTYIPKKQFEGCSTECFKI